MLKESLTLKIEKKLVFLINLLMILLIITFFQFNWDLQYFFYFNVIFTLIVSFIYFKKSKSLSKELILTNMFIFFYFLYPNVAWFFTALFKNESYIYILFYTIIVSYVFLILSGEHKKFVKNIYSIKSSLIFISLLLGFFFGFLFFLIKEPLPNLFLDILSEGTFMQTFIFLIAVSFLIALSEQMIFSGFLYNSYKKLSSKKFAFIETSTIFVLFHFLRIEILYNYYKFQFPDFFIFYLLAYYFLLFFFMIVALYLYSLSGKNYKGSFLYPVILHFGADLGLFLFH
jgi:membrane protease YdiL (CAAX protease family)